MGAEAGAVLSGMEFSGQYGVSHADATVTKNLIFDWATFSDSSGQMLEGDDIFELLARHLPAGPVYAMIDKASPIHSGRTATRAAEYFSAAGSAEHRSIPPALPGHSALRRHRPRRWGPRDRRRRRNVSAVAFLPRGTLLLVRRWSARPAGAAVQTRLGRSPRVPLRDARLRHMPRRLVAGAHSTRRPDGGPRENTPRGPRSTRGRPLLTFPSRRLRCFLSNATSRAMRSVCKIRLLASTTRADPFTRRNAAALTRGRGGADGRSTQCSRRRAGSAQAPLSAARPEASIVGAISRL